MQQNSSPCHLLGYGQKSILSETERTPESNSFIRIVLNISVKPVLWPLHPGRTAPCARVGLYNILLVVVTLVTQPGGIRYVYNNFPVICIKPLSCTEIFQALVSQLLAPCSHGKKKRKKIASLMPHLPRFLQRVAIPPQTLFLAWSKSIIFGGYEHNHMWHTI